MRPNRTTKTNTADNRRIALQIASQLPPDPDDAAEVLAIAADIVRRVYGDRQPSATVVQLVE
jgi:hypothetical protein